MNVQVVQSQDSTVPNKNLRFHLVKSFEDSVTEEAASTNCCLKVSSRYGVTFILHNGNLRLIESRHLLVRESLPSPIKGQISTLALSCDESLLAIAQGSTVNVYETKFFCQQPSGAQPRSSFIVSKVGAATTHLAWNPADPKLIAALGQDGTILLIRILDNWAIEAVSAVDTSFRCMSWSPKGKQLAVGGASWIVQLKLDLKEAKRIPLPGQGQECISIYWLSTLQFLVSFQPQSHDDIKIMLLTLSKTADAIYKDFGDIFLSDEFVNARVISKVIPQWKLHLLFSSTSSDVIVISNDPSLPLSDLVVQEIEDRYRAALPLDNFCRGAGIFLGCSESVVINGEDLRGVPVLVLLSQKGLVTLFKVVHDEAPPIYAPVPEPVPISGGTATTPAPQAAIGNLNANLLSQQQAAAPLPLSVPAAAPPTNASLFGSFQLPTATTAAPATAGTGQSFFGNLNLNLGATIAGAKPLFGAQSTIGTGTGSFLGTSAATPASAPSFFSKPAAAPTTTTAGAAPTSLFGSSAPAFNFGAFSSPVSAISTVPAPATATSTAPAQTTVGFGAGSDSAQAKPFNFSSFSLGDTDKRKLQQTPPQAQPQLGGIGGGGDGLGMNIPAQPTARTATSQAQVQLQGQVQGQVQPNSGLQLGTAATTTKPPGSLPTDQQLQEMKSHLQKYDYKNLLEQLNAFERRYGSFKKAFAEKTKANKEAIQAYFSQLDTQILKDLHQITDFARDIIETTNGQKEEIEGLIIMLQNLFTKIEYGLVAAEKNMDSKYLRLLRSQPVDPTSLAKLTKVDKQFTYVNHQLKECRRHFHYKDQNLRPLDRQVSADFLRQTVDTHSMIILNLKKQVTDLRQILNEQQFGRTLNVSKNHITLDDIASGVSSLKLKPTPEEKEMELNDSKSGSFSVNIANGRVVPKAIVYDSDKIQELKGWAGQTLITRVPVAGAIDPYRTLSAVRKIRLNPEVQTNLNETVSPVRTPTAASAFAYSGATTPSFFSQSVLATSTPAPAVSKPVETSAPSLLSTKGPSVTALPAATTSSSLLFGALSNPTEASTAPPSFFNLQPQKPVSPSVAKTTVPAPTPAFSFGSQISISKIDGSPSPASVSVPAYWTSSDPSFFSSSTAAAASAAASSKPSFFTLPSPSIAKVAPSVQEVPGKPVPAPVQTSVPASTVSPPAFSFLPSSTTSSTSATATTSTTATAPSLFGSPVFSFGTTTSSAAAKPATAITSAPTSFFGGVGGPGSGSIFGSSLGAAAGKPLFGFSSATTPSTPSSTAISKPALLPTPTSPPIYQMGAASTTSTGFTTTTKTTSESGPVSVAPTSASAGGGFSTLSALLSEPSKRPGGQFGASVPDSPASPSPTPEPPKQVEEVKPKIEILAESPTQQQQQQQQQQLPAQPPKTEIKSENTPASTPQQAQSPLSSNLFGTPSSDSGSLFGSLSITPVATSASATPAPAAASIFGGSSVFGGKSSPSIFGGAVPATTTPTTGTSVSLASSPATSTSTSAFGGVGTPLGGTTTVAATPPSLFGTPAAATSPPSLFGTPAAAGAATATTAAPATVGTPSLFGTAATAQSPTPSLFGTPAGSTAAQSPSVFGQGGAVSPSVFGTPGGASVGSGASSLFGTPTTSTPSLFGTPAPNVVAPAPQAPSPSIFGGDGGGAGSTSVATAGAATSPLGGPGTGPGSGTGLFGSSPFGSPSFGSPAAPQQQQPPQGMFGSSSFGGGTVSGTGAGGGILKPPTGLFSSVQPAGAGTGSSVFGSSGTTGQVGGAFGGGSPAAAPAFGGGAVFGGSPAFGSTIKPSAFGSNSIFGGGSTAVSTGASFGDLAVGTAQPATAGFGAASQGFGGAQQSQVPQQQQSSFGAFGGGAAGSAFGGGQTQSAFGSTGSSAFGGGASFGQVQPQQPANSAFGGSPSFGGGAVFGGSPAFGSGAVKTSAFGGGTGVGTGGGSIFGGGSATAPGAAPTFGALASSPTAQQGGGSMFGGGQAQSPGFSSFGSFGGAAQQAPAQSAFGGGASFGSFGGQQQPQQQQPQAQPASFGGNSFSSWR